MTISIPAKANPRPVLAYHHTEDGVKGYKIRIGVEEVFIAEAEADKLARYMLFTAPELRDDLNPTPNDVGAYDPVEGR